MKKVTEKQKRIKANKRTMRWQAKSLERVTFVLNVSTNERDKVISNYLKTRPNVGAYIKNLIEEDIAKQEEYKAIMASLYTEDIE